MHKENDTLIGLFTGAIGGTCKYFLLIDANFFHRFFEAGLTALFCGLCGVAGKEFWYFIKRKIKK